MKAGNYDRVVLHDDLGPWAVALGRDSKAQHENGCEPLLRWLGIVPGALTVSEACGRPMAASPGWTFVDHGDYRLASVLFIGGPGAVGTTARRIRLSRRQLVTGNRFFEAHQWHDGLVTAWGAAGAALAAFRPSDRQLMIDMAAALSGGRLAAFDGGEVGPVLVHADRVPSGARLAEIAEAAERLCVSDWETPGVAYVFLRPASLASAPIERFSARSATWRKGSGDFGSTGPT